jgi:adenosylcobinamide-phosphate synthase
MTFFAVLFALLLEQLKPLPQAPLLRGAAAAWADWTARNLDAGRPHHPAVVWSVTVVAPAVLAALVYLGLRHYSLLLALAFDVLVLYLTLGFRQFTHYVTDIRDALDRGDELEARRLLAQWRQVDTSELPRSELLRQVIEHALLSAHRQVLGVFFGFVLFSAVGLGPAGAVLYRLAVFTARHWHERVADTAALVVNERLVAIARQGLARLDLVPARLTAVGFSIVGSFEDDRNAWRRDAGLWEDRNEGTVLASAAGAMGVQLGVPPPDTAASPGAQAADGYGIGDDAPPSAGQDRRVPSLPQGAHLQSMIGLVWRSLALWMLLVALLTLANVLG